MTSFDNKEIWIFLSHSSADFDKVRLIRNYLEEKSFRPLMFYLKCLNSDEETYNLITREIDVRTRFILCDSENARASEWVKREMDYITSKDPKRSYEILDLSKPIEELQSQLDTYTNQTNIFISYARTDKELSEYICNRLRKYDLKVLCDYEFLDGRSNFAEDIKKEIRHAANNGYFISVCSSEYINSNYCLNEMQYAKSIGANIVPIAIDENAFQYLFYAQNIVDPKKIINLSINNWASLADEITDAILETVLPAGARITHAENFRTGKLNDVDIDESEKQYKLLLKRAEESQNPHALRFIGRCYEYGLGVEKDLRMAVNYYEEYIHAPEINYHVDEVFLVHVKELHEQLYGVVSSRNKQNENLLCRSIKRIFNIR